LTHFAKRQRILSKLKILFESLSFYKLWQSPPGRRRLGDKRGLDNAAIDGAGCVAPRKIV
jgi:hypothetical protein